MNENEFECYGKIYTTVPDEDGDISCDKCDIRKEHDCIRLKEKRMIPECCAKNRVDNRYVHFVKIKSIKIK